MFALIAIEKEHTKEKRSIAEAGLAPRLGRGDGSSNLSTPTMKEDWVKVPPNLEHFGHEIRELLMDLIEKRNPDKDIRKAQVDLIKLKLKALGLNPDDFDPAFNTIIRNASTSFIGESVQHMLKDGVSVRLVPGDFIIDESDGLPCSGWFAPDKKIFACAMGSEFSLEVYTHEFGHYTQWKDGVLKEEITDDEMWPWLNGIDFKYDVIKKSVRQAQLIEADNENRTVDLIKSYGLPIDIEVYRQKSNSYLLFYEVVLRTRRWSVAGKPSYSFPAIYSKLPSDHIMTEEEYTNPPQWFVDELVSRMGEPPKVPKWRKLLRLFRPAYTPESC